MDSKAALLVGSVSVAVATGLYLTVAKAKNKDPPKRSGRKNSAPSKKFIIGGNWKVKVASKLVRALTSGVDSK